IAGIVHNAVELPTAPPSTSHERYLIEVARITPDKGQHLAIEVAQRAGRKVILAGKVERTKEGKRYFEEQIEPFLSPTVEYYPNVAGQQKARLISRAAAGIFPLQWSEPFGLAMVECMVAGTPVLALRTGSTPELIEPGVTGCLAQPTRLGVVVDRQRTVIDPKQPVVVEGVAPDHALPGFLRPHLVEDEVAVGIGDQLSVVDLDRLDPVRVVTDHQVGAVVDRQVTDLAGIVGRDAGPSQRQ